MKFIRNVPLFIIYRIDDSKRLLRKRRASNDDYHKPPRKTQKRHPRDPIIQVAKTKKEGKKNLLLPITTSHSKIKKIESKGLATTQKGAKKPNGKGYSVGLVGEEKIVTPTSPKKQNVPRKRKSSLGRKSKKAQRTSNIR